MFRHLRRFAAALTVLALLSGAASPALASSNPSESSDPMIDLLFLRPVGMVGLGLGFMTFVMAAPFTLIARPTEIGKPWQALVAKPARFVFADPLGEH